MTALAPARCTAPSRLRPRNVVALTALVTLSLTWAPALLAQAPATPPDPAPTFSGLIPLEQAAINQELAAVEAAFAKATGAELRAALDHDRQVLRAAQATLAQVASWQQQKQALASSEQKIQDAEALVSQQRERPVSIPWPFESKHLKDAQDTERLASDAVVKAEAQRAALEHQPERIRAELHALSASIKALETTRRDLRVRERDEAEATEKRRLQRKLAIVTLDVESKALHHSQLREHLGALQRQLLLVRRECEVEASQLTIARRRVTVYHEQESQRLELAREEAQEEAQRLEVVRTWGRPYERTRSRAEAALAKLQLDNQELLSANNSWGRDLLSIRFGLEAPARRSQELSERLEQPRLVDERVAHVLDQLNDLTQQARLYFETTIVPTRTAALAERRLLRMQTEDLEQDRDMQRRAFDTFYAQAQSQYRDLHSKHPQTYTEQSWQAEALLWRRDRERLQRLYIEREKSATQLIDQLLRVEELASEEEERLVAAEATIRQRAFWLRDRPLIDRERLRPVVQSCKTQLDELRTRLTSGKLLSNLLTSHILFGTLLLALLAALVVRLQRRVRQDLSIRLATSVPETLTLADKLRRASLSVALAMVLPIAWLLWLSGFWLWFYGVLATAALQLALVLLAARPLAVGIHAAVRPEARTWRLLPLADDLAGLFYRLFRNLCYWSALYFSCRALLPVVGQVAVTNLDPLFGVVWQGGAMLLLLTALASPAVTSRLLALISKSMAERLRRALLVVGLFVGGCITSVFVLEAFGYRNAAHSVMASLLASMAILTAGLVCDRLIYGLVLSRIGGSEGAAEGGDLPAEEIDERIRARAALLGDLAHTVVDVVISLSCIVGVLWAFEVERGTLDAFLRLQVTGTVGQTGGIVVTDAIFALITVAATILCYRYGRLFLDTYVLQRFGLSRGARFAVTSVAGYLVLAVGMVSALRRVHIELGDLQWFLAAAGVGIGFGLQEILGNFVSGLIILIERPIEVGDIITVRDLDGEVVRITIRATTIQSGDNVSVIVPNKEFITASVINWSHGDPKVRIQVPVGVAYGSNIQLVRKSLLEVANAYGRILKRPAPEVSFRGFGANSLDFTLYVWLADPDPGMRRHVTNDLCAAVDAAFRRHNIVIAFPQLDLHLHPSGPVRLDTSGGGRVETAATASGDSKEP